MPTEPLPWDRKDDFRERKHQRPESFGSNPRWRNSSVASYSPYYGSRDFPRWGSPDFRRLPYNGKQDSWQQFEETSSHVCEASRSGDRMFVDETYRPSVPRGDFRHGRNIRNSRGTFMLRDWKFHGLAANNGATDTIARPCDMSIDQRLGENKPACSASQSDPMKSSDQFEAQHDTKASSSNALSTGQRCDAETSLSSVECKPLKWSQSGSFCSRSSGSSSKSLGAVDSSEMKDENLLKSAASLQSPSGNVTPCVTSAVQSDEAISRKKPRLGWGEGLAKYEKRKVEGPDVNINRDAPSASANSAEALRSLNSSLVDKSPQILRFIECASPATPSSIACSSSPGTDENLYSKAANGNCESNNISSSPFLGAHLEGFPFNLENLDDVSMANLSSSLNGLLQFADPGFLDPVFIRSTAMNRLLVWKSDVLKALEVTESEVERLENELKKLNSYSGNFSPCPASSSSLPVEINANLSKELEATSTLILRPSPLELNSPVDEIVNKTPTGCSALKGPSDAKGDELESPGTATSKFIESLSFTNSRSAPKSEFFVEDSGNYVKVQPQDSTFSVRDTLARNDGATAAVESKKLELAPVDNKVDDGDDILCNNVSLYNMKSAKEASEVFIKLLPGECTPDNALDLSNIGGWQGNDLVRRRIAARRKLMRFKEKVLAIKFITSLNAWKKGIEQLSIRRYRPRSQKQVESGLRVLSGGCSKLHSHTRSRFSSPGKLRRISSPEMVSLASKVHSNSLPRPFRDVLKMPALMLEEKDKMFSRFISTNGLVEDPCAVEKEKTMMNPWTKEEEEIFLEKFAIYRKNFRKIASFLDHKTTADCIKFYYKNHKSDSFEKIKKCDSSKQEKSVANVYLLTSSKKWNRDMNAASLDILGAVSAIAARSDSTTVCRSTLSCKNSSGKRVESKLSQADERVERSSTFDLPEKESFAADILAGFCGSEVMSSCTINCADHGEICRGWKPQRVDSGRKRCLMSDIVPTADDDTCSDDSCGETDPGDWTDEERSLFVHALSSYGKDFGRISRSIGTRSEDQCRVFFSKARKRLGLDSILLPKNVGASVSDDVGGDGSDTECAGALETCSNICNDELDDKMNDDFSGPPLNTNQDTWLVPVKLEANMNKSEVNDVQGTSVRSILPDTVEVDDKQQVHCKDNNDSVNESCVKIQARANEKTQEDPVLLASVEKRMNPATAYGVSSCAVTSFVSCSSSIPNFPAMETREGDKVLDEGVMSVTNLSKDKCEKHRIKDYAEVESNQAPSKLGLNSPTMPDPAIAASVKLEPPVCTMDKSCKDTRLTVNSKKSEQDNEIVSQLDCVQNIAVPPQRNHIDSSHIVSDRLLPVLTTKDKDADVDSGRVSEVQRTQKPEAGINNACVANGFSFRKCNGLMNEQQVLSPDQNSCLARTNSCSLLDTDKSFRNGDVKLFGKILTARENEGKGSCHNTKTQRGKPSTLNCTAQDTVNGHQSSVGRDKGGQANLPIRSYGFWDGNRIQTGLPSLPDSTIMLAKFPAAFANYSAPSSAKEKQVSHSLAMDYEHNLNGVSGYPPREMYVSDRNHEGGRTQPFTLGRDVIYPRNGFEPVGGLQETERGMNKAGVGGGGILREGQCTGISDQAAAIKRKDAKTELFVGQNGSSVGRGKEAWTGNGDIGR